MITTIFVYNHHKLNKESFIVRQPVDPNYLWFGFGGTKQRPFSRSQQPTLCFKAVFFINGKQLF